LTLRDTPTAALSGGLLLATLAVFGPWPASAYFLFDDFAVVDAASTRSLTTLLQGAYGHFRPAGLVLFHVEALAFGWNAPVGWALVSVGLHFLNVALVAALLLRLGSGPVGAMGGSALFAASPWASEAIFWVSAQPDLLAVAGLLGATLAGLAAGEARGGRRAGLLVLALLAAGLALFSKEMAVTLPVLFVLVALAASPGGTRDTLRRAAAPATGMAALTLAYLALRARLLPGLEGPYGRFAEIVRVETLIPNAFGHLREILLPPVFVEASLRPAALAARVIFAALFAAAVFLALRAQRRRTLLLALALVVSLAPVIWSVAPHGSTAGGRMRYLPGIFACALFALGAGDAKAPARYGKGRAAFAAVTFLLGLISVSTQRRLWSAAATLARQSVAQVAALAPLKEPLFVTNLPFAFAEGPYILKSYAFRCALGTSAVAGVRANAVTYSIRSGALVAVRTEPDPFSDPAPAVPERSLTLRLEPPSP
jgi:hypothetical protein